MNRGAAMGGPPTTGDVRARLLMCTRCQSPRRRVQPVSSFKLGAQGQSPNEHQPMQGVSRGIFLPSRTMPEGSGTRGRLLMLGIGFGTSSKLYGVSPAASTLFSGGSRQVDGLGSATHGCLVNLGIVKTHPAASTRRSGPVIRALSSPVDWS